MLKNNKGFTVIELIMSFLFTSILALSLFSAIVVYKTKQVDSTIEADLIAFKSHITMDIQSDIQLKGLKRIENCPSSQTNQNSGERFVPRCVIITFNDNSSKTFSILTYTKEDIIENKDGTTTRYPYQIPYLVYGDIRYDIPDAANVFVDDDYILHTTPVFDGGTQEATGVNLYKINFNLKHNDLDTNINISLVASGSESLSQDSGPYRSYPAGRYVNVSVSSTTTYRFRVIKNSNKWERDITLLFDGEVPLSLFSLVDPAVQPLLNKIAYNTLADNSNQYNGSIAKEKINQLKSYWTYADDVRLLTLEDLSSLAAYDPAIVFTDPPANSGVSTFETWLFDYDFWTMSPVKTTDENNGKKVWMIKTDHTVSSEFVNQSARIRPVIKIKKDYLRN